MNITNLSHTQFMPARNQLHTLHRLTESDTNLRDVDKWSSLMLGLSIRGTSVTTEWAELDNYL